MPLDVKLWTAREEDVQLWSRVDDLKEFTKQILSFVALVQGVDDDEGSLRKLQAMQ